MDQQKIERALDACYEAVAAPEAWRTALDDMSAALDAAAIMFYPKNLSADTAPVPVSEAYEDFLPDFMAGGWYDGHYRSDRGWPLLGTGQKSVIIEHDLATNEERKHLVHYHDLYLRHGYPGFAAIGFEVEGQQWAMCVLRDFRQGFFSPQEAERLEPLVGHFRRMVRLAEKFETSCVSTSLQALDNLIRPAAVLARDGRVCAMNTSCEKMLSQSADSITVANGALLARHGPSNKGLQSLVNSLIAGEHRQRRIAHTRTILVQRPERMPLIVEGHSLAVLGLDTTLHAQAILTIIDPEQDHPSDEQRYRQAFGLTPSEANFARHLASGRSIKDIADAQAVTLETARTRLKSLFAKTETHRQGELVSLLSRVGGFVSSS